MKEQTETLMKALESFNDGLQASLLSKPTDNNKKTINILFKALADFKKTVKENTVKIEN